MPKAYLKYISNTYQDYYSHKSEMSSIIFAYILIISGIWIIYQVYLLPHSSTILILVGISTTNVVIWNYFGKDWRQFLKKIFFSPKGPPFGFRVICSPVFGLREGFIFKLESSGFHQTSSFCELHPHVNAKNPTPKCWFYHPP